MHALGTPRYSLLTEEHGGHRAFRVHFQCMRYGKQVEKRCGRELLTLEHRLNKSVVDNSTVEKFLTEKANRFMFILHVAFQKESIIKERFEQSFRLCRPFLMET